MMDTIWLDFTGDHATDFIAQKRLNVARCIKVSLLRLISIGLYRNNSFYTQQEKIYYGTVLYTKRSGDQLTLTMLVYIHCSGTCAISRYLIRERLNCPTSVIVKASFEYHDQHPSKELRERGCYFFFSKIIHSFQPVKPEKLGEINALYQIIFDFSSKTIKQIMEVFKIIGFGI